MSEQDQRASVPPDKREDFSTFLRGLQEQQITPAGTIEAEEIRATNVVSGIQYNELQINLQVTGNQAVPSSSRKQGHLFMVADLPADFVARPREFEALKQSILYGQREQPTAITTALRGSGGYGKTTLARALCHDSDIQDTFRDGILWVTLGEQPTNLIGQIEDLVYLLSREQPGFTSLEAATTKLGNTLADRACLLVIDDVWRPSDLKPFLHGGPFCIRLITTRNDHVLPSTAQRIQVDAMRWEEAIQVLRSGLRIEPEDGNQEQTFRTLAARLGKCPLLLTLANGVVRERMRLGEALSEALFYLQRSLNKRGVLAFDARNAQERDQALAQTLEVSLAQLSSEEMTYYEELAIFPEDTAIPLETVHRLWNATAGFDELDTDGLCQRLFGLSLLLSYDLRNRRLRLHDVIRNYLQVKAKHRLHILHSQFLGAYGHSNWADLAPDDPYLWEHLAEHLLAAGQADTLIITVKDLRYLATKIKVRGAPAVEQDLALAVHQSATDITLLLLNRQFAKIAHLLQRGQTLHQVKEILLCYLSQVEGLKTLCEAWKQEISPPWLEPWYPFPVLDDPSLMRTWVGHWAPVSACAVSPDGNWIVSSSTGSTLKIWDAHTGEERLTLEGHVNGVTACAVSPDGKWVVSASNDETLKIWDAHTGEEQCTFKGHTWYVTGCAVSPDGKWVVSASGDGTLKIWDAHTGEERLTLKGHVNGVNACAVSPDGKWIVSASDDETLKIWDAHTGEQRFTLEGHRDSVTACAVSPDGKWIVSASIDGTLKIWDTHTGEQRLTLEGHWDSVTGCAVSPDGKWIVSASSDKTLKIWDARTGEERLTLEGHLEIVEGCAVSPDGKWIVSASDDETLKIWDTHIGEEQHTLEEQYSLETGVTGCAVSPDGKWVVSASDDTVLKIWDTHTGEERLTLEGHVNGVNACAVSPDGKWIVSASSDRTLKIWDAHTGEQRLTLKGHTGSVTACAVSPDGKWIVSASSDKTLKIWDARTGEQRLTLMGHRGWVRECAVSPNGNWIVSASNDKTLKVWNKTLKDWDMIPKDWNVAKLRTLKGHRDFVCACAVSPDGKWIVSASDDTVLKIWDAHTGEQRLTLEGHRDFVCACAVSPDGMWIVSASDDETLKIWDAHTGEQRFTLKGHTGSVTACAVSPDGKWIVSSSDDTVLKILGCAHR